MNRIELEKKYLDNGLEDFKLQTPEDLKIIHGIDIKEIKGFIELDDNNKIIFGKYIVNFFNAWGLDARLTIVPVATYYVEDYPYLIEENGVTDIGGFIVKAVLLNGKRKIIHDWIHDDYKNKNKEIGEAKEYLRFEYKHNGRNEWLHIMDEKTWF